MSGMYQQCTLIKIVILILWSVIVCPVFALHYVKGFREPDFVAGGFVPSIASGCEVAEVDLAWLAVAFQICSGYHRGCKGHPREIVAFCRGQGDAAVLGRLDYHAFIHETVVVLLKDDFLLPWFSLPVY